MPPPRNAVTTGWDVKKAGWRERARISINELRKQASPSSAFLLEIRSPVDPNLPAVTWELLKLPPVSLPAWVKVVSIQWMRKYSRFCLSTSKSADATNAILLYDVFQIPRIYTAEHLAEPGFREFIEYFLAHLRDKIGMWKQELEMSAHVRITKYSTNKTARAEWATGTEKWLDKDWDGAIKSEQNAGTPMGRTRWYNKEHPEKKRKYTKLSKSRLESSDEKDIESDDEVEGKMIKKSGIPGFGAVDECEPVDQANQSRAERVAHQLTGSLGAEFRPAGPPRLENLPDHLVYEPVGLQIPDRSLHFQQSLAYQIHPTNYGHHSLLPQQTIGKSRGALPFPPVNRRSFVLHNTVSTQHNHEAISQSFDRYVSTSEIAYSGIYQPAYSYQNVTPLNHTFIFLGAAYGDLASEVNQTGFPSATNSNWATPSNQIYSSSAAHRESPEAITQMGFEGSMNGNLAFGWSGFHKATNSKSANTSNQPRSLVAPDGDLASATSKRTPSKNGAHRSSVELDEA